MNHFRIRSIAPVALMVATLFACGKGREEMGEWEIDAPESLAADGSKAGDKDLDRRFEELEALSRRQGPVDDSAAGPVKPAEMQIMGYDGVCDLARKAEQAGNLKQAEYYYIAAKDLIMANAEEMWKQADILRTLGFFYHMKMNDPDRAERAFLQMIEVREKDQGAESRHVADACIDLTGVLNHAGRAEAALPFYERALKIYEKETGPESQRVGQVRRWYGDTLVTAGRVMEGDTQLKLSKEILEKVEAAKK